MLFPVECTGNRLGEIFTMRRLDRDIKYESSPRAAPLIKEPIFWIGLLLLASALVVMWRLSPSLQGLVERANLARDWIASFGPLAPLAYIFLNIAQVVIAPFPGNLMGVLSGYLFGIFWGTVYSITGLAIGAAIAISVGRFFGRPLLVRFFDEQRLQSWEGRLRMRSPALWAIIFMFPVPDLLIYMAGMSSVPIRWLLPAIIFGRGVGILFANVMGGWSARLPVEWLLIKWSIIAALALLLYRYQRDIRLYLLLAYRRLRRLARRCRPWTEFAARPSRSMTTYASETAASNELRE